jgi:uncharacterized protein (DUF488 family)
MQTFLEYVYKQKRESKRHLEIIKKLLEQNNFKVNDKTGEDDPYLFVQVPEHNLTFGGLRVYQIGNRIAFRTQKRVETEPYGMAYGLDIEEMYEDLLDDNVHDKQIAENLIKSVVDRFNDFFKKSKQAEEDRPIGTDPLNKAYIRSTGTDYANLVLNNAYK